MEEEKAVKVNTTTMSEESPVSESKSNGEIEKAIQTVQDQVRAVKGSLESRYGQHIPRDHPSVPWLIRHASQTLNRFHIGKDGKTAYERMKGKQFKREVAEFGECVWYFKPGIKGKNKMEPRWESGIWLGIRDVSGEIIVGTAEGVLKAR